MLLILAPPDVLCRLYAYSDSYSFDVAPRTTINPILDNLYSPSGSHGTHQDRRIRQHPQDLALIFIIFAMGARHNLEWNLGEGPEEEYLALAKTCLARGAFMTHHTISAIQTLVSRVYTRRNCWSG